MNVERFRIAAEVGLRLVESGRVVDGVLVLETAEAMYDDSRHHTDPSFGVEPTAELRALRGHLGRVLAEVAMGRGDYDAAMTHLVRLLELEPDDPRPFLDLSRLTAEARRHGEARRYYREYRIRMRARAGPVAPFPSSRRVTAPD